MARTPKTARGNISMARGFHCSLSLSLCLSLSLSLFFLFLLPDQRLYIVKNIYIYIYIYIYKIYSKESICSMFKAKLQNFSLNELE